MPQVVYIFAFLVALSCGILLFRGYQRSERRLLLWSSLCFFILSLENLLLFVDLFIVPDIDLRILRGVVTLVGMLFLIYGLVWERE